MIIRALIAAAITWPVLMAVALAQSTLTGADLFVDLEQYVGKQVLLTNVEVYGAGNSGAIAAA